MKRYLKAICPTIILVSCLASSVIAATAPDEPAYNNSTTDLNTRFKLGNAEVGDEIILNAGPNLPGPTYQLKTFAFEYYAVNAGPNAQMQVRIYLNDGGAYGSSQIPGTPIWTSGFFSISDTVRSTLNFGSDYFGTGLTIPNHLTWSVQVSGVQVGGDVGLDLYGPPTVGNNYSDYWYHAGTGWELRTLPGLDVDFGAEMLVVPEPTTLTLLGGFGLALLVIRRRR